MQDQEFKAMVHAGDEEVRERHPTSASSSALNQRGDIASSSSSASVPVSPTLIKDLKKNGLDAMSLSKWNRLAEKGGIGTAIALEDCIANRKGELMFFAGDKITVLRVLIEESTYLGQCEGVIGRFYHEHVQFVQGLLSTQPQSGPSSSSLDHSTGLTTTSPETLRAISTPTPQPSDLTPSNGFGRLSFVTGQSRLDKDTSRTGTNDVKVSAIPLATEPHEEVEARNPSETSNSSSVYHTDEGRPISDAFISSPTRLHQPNLNSSNKPDEEEVRAMALALKTFAKDDDNDLDVHEGLRSRQSRRSSTENSDATWSSADEDESDEDSDASIRYPTTVSFIDRIKALRIPMTAAQEMQSTIPQNVESSEVDDRLDGPERIPQNRANEEPLQWLETPEKTALMSITPPPRPERSLFRDQQSGIITPGESSGVAPGGSISPVDDIQVIEAFKAHVIPAESVVHLGNAIDTTTSSLTEGREKPVLTLTRESSQFEYSTGLSAVSTPSGIDKPEERTSSLILSSLHHPSEDQSADLSPRAATATEGSTNAEGLLQIPEPVAREIANRFSTASDVLRKNYVNDAGVQSYFPVVEDVASVKEAAGVSDEPPTEKGVEDNIENSSLEAEAHMIPVPTGEVETISAQSTSDVTEVDPSLSDIPQASPRPGIAEEESDDEWDVSNDYARFSTSTPSEPTETLPETRKHLSVLSDSTNMINNTKMLEHDTPMDMPKKAGKGILKVQTSQSPSTSQQNGFSPRSIRTPTNVQALRNASLEASLSPDTARFRAFSFVSAAATGTPTKDAESLDTQCSALSPEGQQSAIATKLVQDDTLHGQLSMELSSARHPVPINFLLGQSVNRPQSATRNDSPLYSTPHDIPFHRGESVSPSPTLSRPSPSAPASPFFPSSLEKPRAKSFSTVEVPLPMHHNDSTNPLIAVYTGVTMQTPAATKQHQGKENRTEGSRRSSLSRTSTSKLSAIRRKLSLRGEQRPDMAAILAKEDVPPLPTSSHSTPSTSHSTRESSPGQANIQISERKAAEAQNSLAFGIPTSTATVGLDLPPLSINTSNSFPPRTSIGHDDYRSPSVAEAKFEMQDLPDRLASTSIPNNEPIYDRYGFLALESPAPQSFATTQPSEKEISKLEQTLLALTEHPPTSSSEKKVTHLVESHHIPPSVRGRVWQWLLHAPPIPHNQYQAQVDSFEIPPLRMDPGLLQRFGSHRVFMHGFHTVEQMMFLYITQNRSPPSPDTIWIASLFLTQSFHEAEGYALYQGFLQRMMDNGTDKQIKSWAQTIHEVIHAHDPELAQHLAKCLDLYYIPLRRWMFTMFAEALPLPTCLRAMDLVIVQGPPAIMKLACTIFLMLGKQIIKLVEPSEIINLLLHPPQDWMSPDNVFRAMSKITLPKKSHRQIEVGKRR